MADGIPDRAPELLGVNYFFAILAFLTVLLRCYVRIFIVKKFSFDDLVMVIAMVCDGPCPSIREAEAFGMLCV